MSLYVTPFQFSFLTFLKVCEKQLPLLQNLPSKMENHYFRLIIKILTRTFGIWKMVMLLMVMRRMNR
jgi:hypothetical protein